MNGRMWRAHVRLGELRQRLARLRWPGSLHYVAHSWPLRPGQCPCDVDFCDYLETNGIRGRRIFHLGTGGHHLVGLRNHEAGWRNDILGLTIAPREHARYVKLAIRDPALMSHYHVLFGDVHRLGAPLLPEFDLVSLFHLGEFGGSAHGLDAASVLGLFLDKLAPGGQLLFYRHSFGFARVAEPLVALVARGRLQPLADHGCLAIYHAGPGTPRSAPARA
jgi:hypothetical protein